MATQKVFCSYQEIIDLHTESDKVSVIGIHTPTGDTPHKMFRGFYDQFKKFKYLGCDITLVPSARLPVDPLQVSLEAGEPTIDPRDTLNPIMFHGCHGEDLGNILNSLYTVGDLSAAAGHTLFADEAQTDALDIASMHNMNAPQEVIGIFEKLYYKALTDNSWRKAHPLKGFKKGGLRPMIYKVAALHQIMPGQSMQNTDLDALLDAGFLGYPDMSLKGDGSFNMIVHPRKDTIAQQFMTNRITSLGWIDTRTPLDAATYSDVQIPRENQKYDYDPALYQMYAQHGHLTELPKIFMGVILMPPAYKTEQYFRMIINHRFAFAGFRSISFQNDIDIETPSYFDLNNGNSNDLGSGGDDNGGDDQDLPLSEEITLAFTPHDEISCFEKFTYNDTEYTATDDSSPVLSGAKACFVLYNDTVYLGCYTSSTVTVITAASGSGSSIAFTASNTSSSNGGEMYSTHLNTSPSSLKSTIIDGGIELGE